jgi:hypothetical protein
MRALALTAVVVVLTLGVSSAALGAEPKRQVAAGSARFEGQSGVSRVFTFSATQTTGRRATGWATIDYAPGPRLRLEVSCLWVSGNRALVGGKISSATSRQFVGRTAVFIVEDGGVPARDLFTYLFIAERGEKPYSCTNYPHSMVLLKPAKGAVRIGRGSTAA